MDIHIVMHTATSPMRKRSCSELFLSATEQWPDVWQFTISHARICVQIVKIVDTTLNASRFDITSGSIASKKRCERHGDTIIGALMQYCNLHQSFQPPSLEICSSAVNVTARQQSLHYHNTTIDFSLSQPEMHA